MILDEPGISITPPPPVRLGWIVTFSDLMALMLTFFVMLYSVSSRDPSKVDSTVSGLTQKFAKSTVPSDLGTVASQTGMVIPDQEYLDSVISTIRGSDAIGEVKLLRSEGGTLMVRLSRDKVFVPRTGVMSPEGLAMVKDIVRAMLRKDSAVTLPMIEIRIVGTTEEFSDHATAPGAEAPVIVRQAGRFARTLMDAQVPSLSIATVVLEGDAPKLDIAFYTISAPEPGAAVSSPPP